jgi:hypothetical protein
MNKEYPRKFEDVLGDEYCDKVCKMNEVTTDLGINSLDYAKEIRALMVDYQKIVFNYLIKFYWLIRKFTYFGHIHSKRKGNGMIVEQAYRVFFLKHVGISFRIITGDSVLSKVTSYFDDFFPDFDARNPFEEELKYPYKYVNFDFLILVYRMEERMEFLKIAEERKMTYREFLNYVTNFVGNYNEEHGETYILKDSSRFTKIPLYVGKAEDYIFNKKKKKKI